MKSTIAAFIFLLSFSFSTYSQSNFDEQTSDSPYKTSWAVDGTWIGVGLGLNALGLKLIQDKEPISEQEINNLSKEDVPKIDRWLAGEYSENADKISYYPFYGSFAVPFVMMLTKDFSPHAGQLSVMFIETMATTGALYTITAGSIDRSRPLVYSEEAPMGERQESGSRRSFFAGHTAATASATFFAAKIFHDFNPDSPARFYVWTAAAVVPAYVAYLRSKAGKHFLTDNLVGYGIGAAAGILIPELHKKENERFSLTPMIGDEYKGLSLHYSF